MKDADEDAVITGAQRLQVVAAVPAYLNRDGSGPGSLAPRREALPGWIAVPPDLGCPDRLRSAGHYSAARRCGSEDLLQLVEIGGGDVIRVERGTGRRPDVDRMMGGDVEMGGVRARLR